MYGEEEAKYTKPVEEKKEKKKKKKKLFKNLTAKDHIFLKKIEILNLWLKMIEGFNSASLLTGCLWLVLLYIELVLLVHYCLDNFDTILMQMKRV